MTHGKGGVAILISLAIGPPIRDLHFKRGLVTIAVAIATTCQHHWVLRLIDILKVGLYQRGILLLQELNIA